jgi:hypothetical protein
MKACADMTLANAIEDMAREYNILESEARDRILNSKAYECLYDFESGLWMEGPDYFRDFMKKEALADNIKRYIENQSKSY